MLTGNGGRGVYFPVRGFKVLGHKYQNSAGNSGCGSGGGNSGKLINLPPWLKCLIGADVSGGVGLLPTILKVRQAGQDECFACLLAGLITCIFAPEVCPLAIAGCEDVCGEAVLAAIDSWIVAAGAALVTCLLGKIGLL